MAVFFTSDHHFGDHRVLNLYPRPFASVADMDSAMIARWNETVGKGDEVWHLGDFARTARRAAEVLAELNGRKHLIVGNNDPTPEQVPGWASVAPYVEVEADGVRLVLCHYPFRTWNGMHRGSLNLHGHSHGRMKPLARQLDVGVDVHDYRPIGLPAAVEAARGRRSPGG